MNGLFWFQNLWALAVQVGVVVVLASLPSWLMRVRKPGFLHGYWRLVLLGCLLLPLVEPSRPLGQAASEEVSTGLAVVSEQPAISTVSGAGSVSGWSFPRMMFWLIVAGAVVRGAWLLAGFLRLRSYSRGATPLVSLSPEVVELQSALGISHARLVVADIPAPVTFGWLRPVIVFPSNFNSLETRLQYPVACHEFLHVKRRDWAWHVVEELLLVPLWFHPAFWWVVTRIRVTREQVVDRGVVSLLGDRKEYVESLLRVAASPLEARPVPATLLLTENHLADRVSLILKEGSMKPLSIGIFIFLSLAFVLPGGFFAVRAFPLLTDAVADEPATPAQMSPMQLPGKTMIRVGNRVAEKKLIHRVEPPYPGGPDLQGADGEVVLQVTINEQGNVERADALAGHPVLRELAEEAVRQWRYSPFLLKGEGVTVMTNVIFDFSPQTGWSPLELRLDAQGAIRSESIAESGLPGAVASAGAVEVTVDETASFREVEAAFGRLQSMGARRFRIRGPYVLQSGRLYCRGYGVNAFRARPPEMRLDDLEATPGDPSARAVSFMVYLDEQGRVVEAQQIGGDRAKDVQIELLKRTAARPAVTASGEAVPYAFVVNVSR